MTYIICYASTERKPSDKTLHLQYEKNALVKMEQLKLDPHVYYVGLFRRESYRHHAVRVNSWCR